MYRKFGTRNAQPINRFSRRLSRSAQFAFIFLCSFIATTAFAQQFTATTVGDYGNVTVMEVAGNYDADLPGGVTNSAPREAVAKEFFKLHKDEYDFLVIFTNFEFQMPDDGKVSAFYMGVKNDTRGIGQEQFNHTQNFDSSGRLQGTIDMGNIARLADNPLDENFKKTLYILSHELMHRWGAYLKLGNSDGTLNTGLLGRDGAHWSFLFDSGGSVLYGNHWRDNGNGTFTSTEPQAELKFYSPLDLYLMGMIGPEKVPPMLLIDNPSVDPARLPEAGVTITGAARTVTIDDIIAANGPRSPDAASAQKSFKTAFIFITQPGTFTGDELYGIENIRNGWVTRYSVLTDGAGIVQVASTPREDVPANPGVLPPSVTPRTLPPDIADGVRWLMNNQQNDGSWMDLSETARRDTAEAAIVLKNFEMARQNRQNGLQWLTGITAGNTDYLTRSIAALMDSGQDASALAQELVSLQNADGGWGSSGRTYASNAVDTALALKALYAAGYAGQGAASKAIAYLTSRQNQDGGWSGEDAGGMIQATVNALAAFNSYRKEYSLDDRIARGIAWLLAKQNDDGGFGNSPSTVYDTALAISALRELNVPTDITNRGLSFIQALQSENGSWYEAHTKRPLRSGRSGK